MAGNSEADLKKIFDNPELLNKIASLITEEVSKSNIVESTDDVSKSTDANSKNNKRQLSGKRGRRPYKRRKIMNPSPRKENSIVENIKLMLQSADVKQKILERIPPSDKSADLSDKQDIETTHDKEEILNTNEDTNKSSVEQIVLPSCSADVLTKMPTKPNIVRSFKVNGKLTKKSKSELVETQSLENVSLDKRLNYYTEKQGAGVVVDNETKNDSPKKDEAIVQSPVQTLNDGIASTENANPTHESVALEQSTELNAQSNGDSYDVSQSDDFTYLSMINSDQMSVSNEISEAPTSNEISNASISNEISEMPISNEISEAPIPNEISEMPKIKNVTSNVLDASNINNLFIATGPSTSTSAVKQKIFKPLMRSNQKIFIPSNIIRNQITIPKLRVGSKTSLSIPSFQTILVLTENGQKPVQVINPRFQFKRILKGSKPVIKSNEKVRLQWIQPSGSATEDSVISDASDNSVEILTEYPKLPKIESVTSLSKSLPIKIESVTSCATTLPSIKNAMTSVPSLNAENIISTAERLSPDLVSPSEKILKITRKVNKDKGKKKLQPQILSEVANNNESMPKKNSESLNSSVSVDATADKVITSTDQVHNTKSVALEEKKSPEDLPSHVNGLNVTHNPTNKFKVKKPVGIVKDVHGDVKSEFSKIKFVAIKSVDDCGFPSIQNVVSLAKNHGTDDCLEEADKILSKSNGIYGTKTPEKKLKVIKPVVAKTNEFSSPPEPIEEATAFGNWDVNSESTNDDFNFAIDSLIEDMSGKKSGRKSLNRSKKSSPPFSLRQTGTSNGRNKGLKVLKPVIRKKKTGRPKRGPVRKRVSNVENSIQTGTDAIENVHHSIESGTDDVLDSLNFADLSLVDAESPLEQSECNDVSHNQSKPNKSNILHSKISPIKLHKNEETGIPNNHIAQSSNNNKAAPGNTSGFSMDEPEECDDIIEEVPLQQRRCNNFYVKVPTGEELGSDFNLEEYEKFFSIQDENNPRKRIRKPEIETLPNDEDLPGTPSKRRTKCSKCDKTFINSENRKIHEATCDNNEPQTSECSKCGRWFAKAAYRKVHEKKCQKVYGTIEVPVAPLNAVLRCAMCPFTTRHKPGYINHLKSHMYGHKKKRQVSARTAALRRKFGYRRKKRKFRSAAATNTRCETCNDDAGGVEHMVSRCRSCGAFNLQWCEECNKGGFSTSCRLRHHEAECSATPHTRCNEVPVVRVERLGPPLPLHCVTCDVTRIMYIREKNCKQCQSPLMFKCEMCNEMKETFAELVGHVARHINGCLDQCDDCGINCEDIELHRQTCEGPPKEDITGENALQEMYYSEEEFSSDEMPRLRLGDGDVSEDSNSYTPRISSASLTLELDEEEFDEDEEHLVEEV